MKALIKWTPIKEQQLEDAQKGYEFAVENYDAMNKLYIDELTSPIKDAKFLAETLKLVNDWGDSIAYWKKQVYELTSIKYNSQIQFTREEITQEGTDYEKALIRFKDVHKAFIDDLISFREGSIEIFTGMYSTFRALGDDDKAWECIQMIQSDMDAIDSLKAEKEVL